MNCDRPIAQWRATAIGIINSTDNHILRAGRMLLVRDTPLTRRTKQPPGDRLVLRDWKAIDTTIPDYAELD